MIDFTLYNSMLCWHINTSMADEIRGQLKCDLNLDLIFRVDYANFVVQIQEILK